MYDIFISYAHADDEPPLNVDQGWVTTFTEELKKRLRAKLGGSGANVWMDHSLAMNEQVTATLLESVRQSRTLILFLSPAYQRSEWCQRELGKFLEVNQAHKNKESVFIVEVDEVDRRQWHPRIRELTPLQFWEKTARATRLYGYPKPNPSEDNPYWRQLNELAHLIAAHLRFTADINLTAFDQTQKNALAENRSQGIRRPVVWIAEPTDDLIDKWHELEAAVRQFGGEILPVSPEMYERSNLAAFRAGVENDLAQANLLIQLISAAVGPRMPNSDMTYTSLQHSLAIDWVKRNNLTFLQWRPFEVGLEIVSDHADRAALTGVMACGFEEFRQRVLKTLEAHFVGTAENRQGTAETSQGSGKLEGNDVPPLICVNANAQDRDLSLRISEMLVELGVDTVLSPEPSTDESPAEFRKQLAQVVENSQGVLFVYGRSNPAWIQAQYIHARKIVAQHRRGIWGALLDGPPSTKAPHGVASANLMMIDCRAGLMRDHLARFVDVLRGSGNV
jgi:hypothetical protein